jgi:hypothetical protein
MHVSLLRLQSASTAFSVWMQPPKKGQTGEDMYRRHRSEGYLICQADDDAAWTGRSLNRKSLVVHRHQQLKIGYSLEESGAACSSLAWFPSGGWGILHSGILVRWSHFFSYVFILSCWVWCARRSHHPAQVKHTTIIRVCYKTTLASGFIMKLYQMVQLKTAPSNKKK